MKTLTVFIVYHKNIYKDNTKTFHIEHVKKSLSWVAVNESIEKDYPSYIPEGCLIKEWELPVHSPVYQMLHFYQNSVFLHIYWNKLHEHLKYIGFAQYDMSIDAEELLKAETSMVLDTADTIYIAFPYNSSILSEGPYPPGFWDEYFVHPYNKHYSMNHSLDNLKTLPLFLLHTFIIPSWFFSHMMPFIEKIIPTILRGLRWNTRHLAGTLERVFALCLSSAIIEGKIRRVIQLNGIKTDIPGQREEDILRGIAKD
jgi:hypothetical protein